MAQAAAQDVSLPNAEDRLQEALKQANTITLNQIASRLKKDPTSDLSELLKQQVNSYPHIRSALAQAARQRAVETPAITPNPAATPIDNARSPFSICGNAQITFPLQNRILSLIASRHSPPEQPTIGLLEETDDDVVAALNQVVADGRVLWNFGSTVVLDLGSSIAVKIGRSVDTDHVPTLQYVKDQAPEVPAPDILGILKTDRQTYFFMSRAEGVPLHHKWGELLPSHKASIQHQLNAIFSTLRMIPRPQVSAEATLGGGFSARCKDVRRSERVAGYQIKTEAAFNDFLCTEPGRSNTPWIKMIRSFMRDDHVILMTHGDLHPRNIMVTWDGNSSTSDHSESLSAQQHIRITSIIDWEMVGWYPEYWEFVKALNTIGPRDSLYDWCDYLPIDAIGAWPAEYAIDLLISRWLG